MAQGGAMSDELDLTPHEVVRGAIDESKSKLRNKLDLESSQGILPFTNELYYEQMNPVVRSSLFTAGKMNVKNGSHYLEWTEIFSFGGGSIHYRGPHLTVDHEVVLVKLMVLARGRSLTKPIHAFQADLLRWLKLDAASGKNYVKARRILDDLAAAEIRISSKPALQRLLAILTSPAIAELPDGLFFQSYINNRFNDQLKMIAKGLADDQPVNVTMKLVTSQTHNTVTKRMMINLDPVFAIFFDGVNTTLLPFEIWDDLDRFGKKLLSLISSHRDGVFPVMLEKIHEFSGSVSEFEKVKRRVKSDLKKRFEDWESKNYIVPGWNISRNDNGIEIIRGLKAGEAVRIRSKLNLPPIIDSDDDIERGSDRVVNQRAEDFANSFVAPAQRHGKSTDS